MMAMLSSRTNLLHEGESLDDLILSDMRVIQPVKGYRFSIDAVLLAHFADLKGIKQVVDLGTGCAVIPLLLSHRDPGIKVLGIELQPAMADRARRCIQINNRTDRIDIMEADIKEITSVLPGGEAELVLSNPPFYKQGEGHVNQNREVAIARHEIELNLDQLVAAAVHLLTAEGRLALIHRTNRLTDIIRVFRHYQLAVSRIRMVHPHADRPANLVLVEGSRKIVHEPALEPPLTIYTAENHYCDEIRHIYGEA